MAPMRHAVKILLSRLPPRGNEQGIKNALEQFFPIQVSRRTAVPRTQPAIGPGKKAGRGGAGTRMAGGGLAAVPVVPPFIPTGRGQVGARSSSLHFSIERCHRKHWLSDSTPKMRRQNGSRHRGGHSASSAPHVVRSSIGQNQPLKNMLRHAAPKHAPAMSVRLRIVGAAPPHRAPLDLRSGRGQVDRIGFVPGANAPREVRCRVGCL